MIAIRADSQNFRTRFPTIIAKARNPRQVLLGTGRELGNQLKTHFRLKDRTEPNKLNPERRQHFWNGVARSVQAPVVLSETKVAVSINDPRIAQKVFGGTIVAKRVRNLSIPVSPEAYGRSPAVFERETGLKLFVLKQGGTASNNKTSIVLAAARGAGIEIEYQLKHSVTQKADPTALPDMSDGSKVDQALVDRAQSIVDRHIREAGLI